MESPDANLSSDPRLGGRVAIVVGAGQTAGETVGNGRATAITYAREGAAVLVVDRDGDSAAETVSEIVASGGRAESFAADATSSSGCEAMAEACLSRFGVPSILHNNVGIGAGDAGITGIEEAAWDHIMAVNLKSVLLPCKAVVPLMREAGYGSIINISSVAAISTVGMIARPSSPSVRFTALPKPTISTAANTK